MDRKPMRFGSVCSGIEAASVAWHPLGWEAAWFSEIEPFPSAVLAHHYPSVPNLGDMTRLPALIRSGAVEVPDILCGGTPCQAFSVAGLRRSLDDERGNLSLTFCEIADAIDEHRPAIIFWENVPGVLNTKDNAFGCFLAGLAGEDEALIPPGGRWTNAGFVDGPARAVAWRVLDAQYFGVAQRRRRVFVIASARADFDPAAVLFERESLRRDTAPRREAGQTAAGTLEASIGRSRGAGTSTAAIQPYTVANCLTQRMHKGINSTLDEGQTPVLQAVSIQDVRAVNKAQNGKGWNDDGTAYTVDTHATQGVAVVQPIAFTRCDYGNDAVIDGTPTMRCGSNYSAHLAVAFAQNQRDEVRLMDVAGAHPPAVAQPMAFGVGEQPDVGHCLRSGASKADKHESTTYAVQAMQVRRLTPVECERLQGFPDGYTNIPWRNKTESPDGPRYKALGNSWAVPVVRWIGERISRAT